MSEDTTTIVITKKQHQKLMLIKERLKREASDDIGLSRQSWSPSFADALENLMKEYRYSKDLENAWQNRDWSEDSGGSGADHIDPLEIDWDDH